MRESARMHARPQGFARQASNPQGWQALQAKRDRYRARPRASKQGRKAANALAQAARMARMPHGWHRLHGLRVQGGAKTAEMAREAAIRPRGVPRGEEGSASGRRVSRMSATNLGAHRTRTPAHTRTHLQQNSSRTLTPARKPRTNPHGLARGPHASA